MDCLNKKNKKDMFLTSHDLLSLPQQKLFLDKKVVNKQTEQRKPLEVKGDRNGESARAKRAERRNEGP